MGCGCGKKQVAQRGSGNQQPVKQASSSNNGPKTPLQVRKERVNKLISIPGTKPR